MPMPIEAKEIAVGDWSPNYGTVVAIKENKNLLNQIVGYNIKFFRDDYEMTNVKPEAILMILQGGSDIVHNGMPDKTQIRPGLKGDHANN